MSSSNSAAAGPAGDAAAEALNKRFKSLASVRTKGKGAWYWAHLEPVLIKNPETHHPKAVKLRCILCGASFSASNPSRTATEHLKRGTCPNFSTTTTMRPAASELPPLASPCSQQRCRKRSSHSHSHNYHQLATGGSYDVARAETETTFPSPKSLLLSGGKREMRPLEEPVENSVKKLNSPKAPPFPDSSQDRANAALGLLADWCYESCGSVPPSSLEHPKFKAFLHCVGLPGFPKSEFSGQRLETKYEEARIETEARINDASFFQISCGGISTMNYGDSVIKFTVNLPNGTHVFHKAVYSERGKLPAEVLWETVGEICGGGNNNVKRCVGIVAGKYKTTSLRNLEQENPWMINMHCQLQAMTSLLSDFFEQLTFLSAVSERCVKVANLINSSPQIVSGFRKLRVQGVELPEFIRVGPTSNHDTPRKNFRHFASMLEDLLNCCRFLLEDSFKANCSSDVSAREAVDLIDDVTFWKDVESAHALVKLIAETAGEIESERPLISQCLRLWRDLRAKIRDWCAKFDFPRDQIENILENRFAKNYRPAWSAAFVLDPLHLIRDSSGNYLPPFESLTKEQEKDVDRLVTRLVPAEEAHVAVMELMKWRSEGLDPVYAQAVQLKKPDPLTGKLKVANPRGSRLVWETRLKVFKSLSKVAARLLFLRATSCGVRLGDWPSVVRLFEGKSMGGLERAHKVVFVAGHAKLKRGNFLCTEEENDDVGEE